VLFGHIANTANKMDEFASTLTQPAPNIAPGYYSSVDVANINNWLQNFGRFFPINAPLPVAPYVPINATASLPLPDLTEVLSGVSGPAVQPNKPDPSSAPGLSVGFANTKAGRAFTIGIVVIVAIILLAIGLYQLGSTGREFVNEHSEKFAKTAETAAAAAA
jgi:hypothetical protein